MPAEPTSREPRQQQHAIPASDNRIDTWLAQCPNPAQDPRPGMRQAGLLDAVPDYAALARTKAALVQRTGLLGVGSVWSGPQLVFRHFVRSFGTEAQRADWRGRALGVAISEPKVGAHPKLLTTRADPAGDGFRITGQKAWVSNGPSADAIIVFAITSEEMGRKRYSAFLVPRDTPGLGISEMPGFHTLRPSRHCLLTLDCVVPVTAVLGPMGTAYERMAMPFRDVEDAVGTFGILGAFRHAIGLLAGATPPDPAVAAEIGAIVALIAVFDAAAASVVAALDDGRLRDGDATLVGLRLLATDITARLRAQIEAPELPSHKPLAALIADLDATLSIARGPRLARQARLGETTLRAGTQPR
jgi:acyl-CoA dehydrogenase